MHALKDNPHSSLLTQLKLGASTKTFYDLTKLEDRRYERLPFSIRVLLESAIRNCDNFQIGTEDVEKILDWETCQKQDVTVEVPFRPARVILQDFTGVPAVVDFAAMRDCIAELGGDPSKINPICPADLVIDHSVQVDFSRTRVQDPQSKTSAGGVSKRDCLYCLGEQDSSSQRTRPTRILHKQHSDGESTSTSAHLSYHRPRSRPLSPVLVSPSPHSVQPQPVLNPIPGVLYPGPYTSTLVLGCSMQHDSPYTPGAFVPYPPAQTPLFQTVLPAYSTPSASYYAGSPCLSTESSRPSSPAYISDSQRDIPLRPRGAQRSMLSSRNSRFSSMLKGGEDEVPSLRVPVSSLPSPQDVPGIPVQDLVCPFHSLNSTWSNALQKNEEIEFERNRERFIFLKWGSHALKNMLIVPPGSGIVHQVNLEYLARVVFDDSNLLYPDSLVGTDSHTTMINGLGVVGWGVGGIEAEAVMLGQAISLVLPKVVGYKITGELSPLATSTDVVLTITKHLRQVGVVGKFVEFFGDGVEQLSLADRATISNMCPEYGATIGFFPVDCITMDYLRQSGREEAQIELIESYLRAVKMFRNYSDSSQDPVFSEVVTLTLEEVVPSVSGPKRPHDKVAVKDMKEDFHQCLKAKVGFKGFGIDEEAIDSTIPFTFMGKDYALKHGSVVIAAVTSCTNTSNPSVMLGAGLLAKKAVEAGLKVPDYVKTSLSPGSGVVTHYLKHSGVMTFLEKLGFEIVGYGCMTCIGNSGPLPPEVVEAIDKGDLVCCGVLSGNRNFEGRIHPSTRANYLASPLLVIAYAIAGSVDIDFELDSLGTGSDGKAVYLKDIWPSRSEIQSVERQSVLPHMFKEVYKTITEGNERWNNLECPKGMLYPWNEKSTYIAKPPFFDRMSKELPKIPSINDAYVLLNLGDFVTTDHISPAGSISRNSPAARHLASRGLAPRDFNSYGSRRGNDAVMARGTFANIRLLNKFIGKASPRTVHIPSGDVMDVFDAAERYKDEGHQVIVLAGKEYGSGSSRDWAAKGPFLLGIKAIIAETYERIHRSNLVGMGIMPLQFKAGDTAETLGLSGRERYTVETDGDLHPGMEINMKVNDGRSFGVILRFDTEVELAYFRNGGILNYMIRKML